jgi:hypothetical protein
MRTRRTRWFLLAGLVLLALVFAHPWPWYGQTEAHPAQAYAMDLFMAKPPQRHPMNEPNPPAPRIWFIHRLPLPGGMNCRERPPWRSGMARRLIPYISSSAIGKECQGSLNLLPACSRARRPEVRFLRMNRN